MNDMTPRRLSPTEIVRAYHERTKHSLKGYAAGPGTLDWDAQPEPFREFDGAPRISLALPATELTAPFGDLFQAGKVFAHRITLETLGSLLRYAFGLAAWKEYGPDRWALRCNPSSGNLHPTEVYAIVRGLPDLEDGLYHYLPREHALERRCLHARQPDSEPGLWIGLTSIHWREAWKYGERAFRYCLLDTGHALGALGYAAAALGWRTDLVAPLTASCLPTLLGTGRHADFEGAEAEDPEALIAITAADAGQRPRPVLPDIEEADWYGQANTLDPHPMYRWPIIGEAAEASCATGEPGGRGTGPDPADPSRKPMPGEGQTLPCGDIFLQRRSAQRFDARTEMPKESFFAMLDALLPREGGPFSPLGSAPRLHPVLFVIRVKDLEPGVYALPRHGQAAERLKALLDPQFGWQKVEGAPEHLPLYRLVEGDKRHIARMVSCGQWIASDGCFSLGMLGEYDAPIGRDPHAYRSLHFEAGLLGQVLYLQAEAAGFRGTGIGCFFDDDFHGALGLKDTTFQSLYHFTVGYPKTDSRITTLPPYPSDAPAAPASG